MVLVGLISFGEVRTRNVVAVKTFLKLSLYGKNTCMVKSTLFSYAVIFHSYGVVVRHDFTDSVE